MRKLFAFALVFVAALASVGCIMPMPTMPGITVRTTGIPFTTRNQVVVSCPTNISFLKVEKIDQWGKEVFVVRPGASVGIRASGMYSDQTMTLSVYGYRESGKSVSGEPIYTLMGRQSRPFQFYDSGNSGQIIVWDVSSSELR